MANGLKIGQKTKLVLGPQSGSIDLNKDLENPIFAKENRGNGSPPVRLGAANRVRSHKFGLMEAT